MRPRENSVFTIQLFPFRLGELIERAERYARETLLPLISEQAPRIFRFAEPPTAELAASSMGGTRNARHLKYVQSAGGRPMTGERLMAAAGADADLAVPVRRQRRIDLPPALGASVRIEAADFEAQPPAVERARSLNGRSAGGRHAAPNLLRPAEPSRESMQAAIAHRTDGYYTSSKEVDGDDSLAVRIALPTYRPETGEPVAKTTVATPKVMLVTAIPIPLSAEH